MAHYSYSALTRTGGEVKGETEAASRAAVIDWLMGLGHTPLAVHETRDQKSRAAGLTLSGSLTPKERLQITRELASLLDAGIALDRSLRIVGSLVSRPKARTLLAGVLERLRGGQSLARAMESAQHAFPPYYLGLIAAGEASGKLKETLLRLASSLERDDQLREKITSALVYPALLLAMTGATFILLITVVLPRLKPLFAEAGANLPLPTQLVLGLGDLVQTYGWLIGAALVIGLIVLNEALRIPALRLALDHLLLRAPLLLGLVQKAQTASLARGLSVLLEAGLPMPAALARVQTTLANRAMAGAVGAAQKSVREGMKLSTAFKRTGLVPKMALELIHIGEETGALPHMLARLGETYEREVTTTLERLVQILVPAVTIIMGLMVGGLVASVLVGILSLNELAI